MRQSPKDVPNVSGAKASVAVHSRIADIPATAWDGCANPEPATYQPFVSHAFLQALEEAGCVRAETGWQPQHIVLEAPHALGGAPSITACMPCYLKGHSMGEYVFDHAWADACMRMGGRYYPKLQIAVPFTPVTGPRFLCRADADRSHTETILLSAALSLVEHRGASGLHATFVTQGEYDRLGQSGLLQRIDQQFHWENQGFATFDEFLETLASRKRKQIRKERREAAESGITMRWVTGSDLKEHHWDAFFAFYMDTASRKWGRPYLNRTFFSLIGERLADRILLILCERAGQPVGGALNFIGGDALYGRYWGALEEMKFLHFEACYYQAIDFAIAHKRARVEAGAQGAHKLARGYLPNTTHSLHYLADPRLHEAVAQFLVRERRMVAMEGHALAAAGPYRRDEQD